MFHQPRPGDPCKGEIAALCFEGNRHVFRLAPGPSVTVPPFQYPDGRPYGLSGQGREAWPAQRPVKNFSKTTLQHGRGTGRTAIVFGGPPNGSAAKILFPMKKTSLIISCIAAFSLMLAIVGCHK